MCLFLVFKREAAACLSDRVSSLHVLTLSTRKVDRRSALGGGTDREGIRHGRQEEGTRAGGGYSLECVIASAEAGI